MATDPIKQALARAVFDPINDLRSLPGLDNSTVEVVHIGTVCALRVRTDENGPRHYVISIKAVGE